MYPDDEDDEFDTIKNDCGESLNLCDADAKNQITKYSIQLDRLRPKREIIPRSDPRSILFGL